MERTARIKPINPSELPSKGDKPDATKPPKKKWASRTFNFLIGTNVYKREFSVLKRDLSLWMLKRGVRTLKNEVDSQRQAQALDSQQLSNKEIETSINMHILILCIFGVAMIYSLFALARSAGFLFLHDFTIANGNYGLITIPIFIGIASMRLYISTKSLAFFLFIKGLRIEQASNDDDFNTDNTDKTISNGTPQKWYSKQWVKALTATLVTALILFVASSAHAGANLPNASPEFEMLVEDYIEASQNPVDDYGTTMLNWIAFGSPYGEQDSGSLASHIAASLSAISLVILAALTSLGLFNYVAHTASDGKPGGQVIKSFWPVMRTSVSTILLIPIGIGGYTTLHYGVINIAKSASSTASKLQAEILDYIKDNSIYTPPNPQGGMTVVTSLLESEVCTLYINSNEKRQRGSNNGDVNHKVTDNGIMYNQAPKNNIFSRVMGGFEGYCGGLAFNNEYEDYEDFGSSPLNMTGNTEKRTSNKAESDNIGSLAANYINSSIRPKVQAIAEKILADQKPLMDLKAGGGQSRQQKFEQAIAETNARFKQHAPELVQLANQYNEWAGSVIRSTLQNKLNASGEHWIEQNKRAGWPAFGLIFWQAQKEQGYLNGKLGAFKPTTFPLKADNYQNDERFIVILTRANELIKDSIKTVPPSLEALERLHTVDSKVDWTEIKDALMGLAQYAIIPHESDANLVTRLQSTGHSMLASAEWGIISLSMIKAAARGVKAAATAAADATSDAVNGGVLNMLSGGLVGSGVGMAKATVYGIATTTLSLAEDFVRFAQFLLGAFIAASFVLAVVLPAIPAIFWLLGVISYLIFFAQCLLVSTFWLAAHGTAEGQGWGTEHTRQGYFLMLGLFLAPTLRVAGFAMMMLLLIPAGHLTQWLLSYLVGVFSSQSTPTPLMFFGVLVILAVFAYTALVRIFQFPTELYELGLKWVNGGQEVTGDTSAEQTSRSHIAVFTGTYTRGLGNPRPNAAIPTNDPKPTNDPNAPNTNKPNKPL